MRRTPEEYSGPEHALYICNQPTGSISDIYPHYVEEEEVVQVAVDKYSIDDTFPDQLTALTFYDAYRRTHKGPANMMLQPVSGGFMIVLT